MSLSLSELNLVVAEPLLLPLLPPLLLPLPLLPLVYAKGDAAAAVAASFALLVVVMVEEHSVK